MNKVILLLLSFSLSFSVFAQKGKVTSAQNLKDTGKLDKALETIESTLNPSNPKSEKTIPWPKTWEVRGDIYHAIYQTKDANFKQLSDDPLTEALNSYKKALELDEKGKFDKSIKIKLTLLTNDFSNQAVEAYNAEDFDKALFSFEQVIEIQNIDIVKEDNPDIVDTVIIFNTGLVAYNAQKYEKAIKYYSEAAKYGYNGARTHTLIANAYEQMGDTLAALEAVKQGFEKYPEDNSVLNSMIDYYLKSGKNDEAMKYLNMAIEKDPTNATYYFAQGSLFEKFEDEENALKSYNKAIEVDANHFNSYFNLGVLFYNKGVQQEEIARAVPPNDNVKYQEELKKADVWFEKSIPYLEKCHELNSEDIYTLESLKNLYYRKKDMNKYNVIVEKLGQ